MLSRITAHNFNCFVDFDLALPRRLLLVGSNGSGKTSLWEVLAALQDLAVRGADVADLFPTRSLTRWLLDDPRQRFSIELQVGADTFKYELELLHDTTRRTTTIHRERLSAGGNLLYEQAERHIHLHGDDPSPAPRTSFPWGGKRSFLPDLEARPDNRRTLAFRQALGELWLLAHAPPHIEPTSDGEAVWLERDGSNFSSWFRGVLADDPEVGNALNEALRPTLPGLQKLHFEKISQKVRELMLRFRTDRAEYSLSASELSDGQRSLVLLYGLLVGALPRARLAFLDEPETGLATHEMQPWLAQAAATLDEHAGQLFVISHHPAVVDYLAPERTLRFSRPKGGPTRVSDVTLETTGGARVSDWLGRSWAFEDEHDEAGT